LHDKIFVVQNICWEIPTKVEILTTRLRLVHMLKKKFQL